MHDRRSTNSYCSVLNLLVQVLSTSICRDLQDGDDGVAGAGAAARGEDDCVAACSDHRGDRGNIIASGVHNDCAALRGRNSLFQNLNDGTGAALADAAKALLVQSGQAACLVAGGGLTGAAVLTSGFQMGFVVLADLNDLVVDGRGSRTLCQQMLAADPFDGLLFQENRAFLCA